MGGFSAVPKEDFRSHSGVVKYDEARWLLPPPTISSVRETSGGIGFLVQHGIAAKSEVGKVQETLPPEELDRPILMLFPDLNSADEWHVDGKVRRPPQGASLVRYVGGANRWVGGRLGTRIIHFHFAPAFLARVFDGELDQAQENDWRRADGPIRYLLQALTTELECGNLVDDLALETYAALFARHCFSAAASKASRIPSRGGLAPWQVRRTVEYLNERLNQTVTLAELAAIARLSPYHFARAFRQSLGVPPHAFHNQVRVKRAKALLESSDLSVTEVALSIGFDAPQTLARLFRRTVGITPSQYRNNMRS